MYTCNICNYETDVRTAIYNHNKTKKHITNKEIYDKKVNDDNELLKLKNKEIEELKQELLKVKQEKELKDKEIAKLETKAEIYKELSEKAKNVNNGIIINANTNNLNYVNKHFKNAPPLKKISNYMLNGIDLNDDTQIDKLTDSIIYSYNNKCLHKLIGDHIIENYKKDDQKLQSFHATDIARRKYLVKLEDSMGFLYDESSDEIDNYNPEKDDDNESYNDYSDISEDEEYNEIKKGYENDIKNKSKTIVKNNKSKWTNDNEGVKLSYLLLNPLIKKIIRQLKKKCRNYNDEMKKNINKIPTDDEVKRFEVLANILKEIDRDKLRKNINNHIAPHFGLVKK
jgi:hypothetical protein